DGDGSHGSTSKTPSYTKSVSWHHYLPIYLNRLWIAAKGFVFSYTYSALTNKGTPMKIILWAVLIIFLIGLLVVTGVFKMIF
ncbi:small membrane protein YohP, partial [Escherichia coli]|uniref:small membrane protein YohP n=1 Tax=Escherichia coli TaxID=562 RepID=UPI002075F3BF